MLVVQTLLITLKTLRFCKQHVQRNNKSKICINESSMRFPPIRLDFVFHFNLFAYRFRTVWRRLLRHSTPVCIWSACFCLLVTRHISWAESESADSIVDGLVKETAEFLVSCELCARSEAVQLLETGLRLPNEIRIRWQEPRTWKLDVDK